MRRRFASLVLSLILEAGAATPAVDDTSFIVPEEPAVRDFADLCSHHVEALVREDVAFGQILVRLGTAVGDAPTGGQMLLGEEALARAVSDVSKVREGHRDVLGFREQVIARWPEVSTIGGRAGLALPRTSRRGRGEPVQAGRGGRSRKASAAETRQAAPAARNAVRYSPRT